MNLLNLTLRSRLISCKITIKTNCNAETLTTDFPLTTLFPLLPPEQFQSIFIHIF